MAGQRPVILFDPISESVTSALHARVNEYSKAKHVTIFAGTWNLMGKVRYSSDKTDESRRERNSMLGCFRRVSTLMCLCG
jgi:hypothetical protein